MASELVPFDYSRQIANSMDYRFYMEKALIQDNADYRSWYLLGIMTLTQSVKHTIDVERRKNSA